MRMAAQTQHLVLILLLSSLFISFNSVSASRIGIMIHHGQDFQVSSETADQNQRLQQFINGRMDLQYNDYSGSEANPRHTPKPPGRV